MTTESNPPSGGAVGDRPRESLRLTLGDQAYEVPAERVGHLHAALVVADRACTATGRTAHNKPPEGVTGPDAGSPHYLAADVAGDIAHWIAEQTGISHAPPVPAETAEAAAC